MDGSPSSTHPTSGAASPTAFHIRRHGDPIPVTVHITWTDGMEGEVNGWTSQWTRTHVCVVRESAPRITRSGYGPQTSGGARRAHLDSPGGFD
jgi:hypothetical protein